MKSICIAAAALPLPAMAAFLSPDRSAADPANADQPRLWDPYADLDEWAVQPDREVEQLLLAEHGREMHPPLCLGDAHFFTEGDCELFSDQQRCVAARKTTTFLASYPCSGNTWTRVLLDHLTGIYTGSEYFDRNLVKLGFLGEGHADPSEVISVKTHRPVVSGISPPGVSRAVVLLRRPLEAALSYTTFLFAMANHLREPHAAEVGFSTLRAHFDSTRDVKLQQWSVFTKYWLQSYGGLKLVVHFEELAKDARGVLTTKILPFYGIREEKVRDRLECAVTLSIPGTHRKHAYTFQFTSADKQAVTRIIGLDVLQLAGYSAYE